jgi:multiple sugar transport system substrate-binding protein
MQNSKRVNSRPTPPAAATLSRREFLRLAGVAAAGAALAGCQAPLAQPPAQQTGEKVQLVYQDWRTDWFPPMVQAMLEKFHATHPNIRVFYIPDPESAEFGEKKLADFQAGSAPDVFQGCCTFFPTWAQKGYTLDLRPYVNADLDRATIEDWDPAQYKAFFTKEGVQYGLPKYHGALALYYNKDLFDQYGVEYPNGTWDHDDYRQAMLRLAHDLDGDGQTDLWGSMIDVSWDRLQIHVNGWGGHLVDPDDARRCRMGDPEALAALEWLRARIWDDRAMVTLPMVERAGTHSAFINGRVAMTEDGSWALKDILSGVKFRIGVAPFPAGPVRRVTLATTDGFGIYAGTKHPDAAWEFLKFLISQDYGRAMARANFLQPARASLVGDWVNYIRQEYPGPTQDMEIAAFAEGHLRGYSVITEIAANMDDAQRIANAAWDQILTLGQAPTEQIAVACRQIQAAQAESR